MVHSHKIRPGKSLLGKTFMVSALAFSALASHAKGGIIKRAEALDMRSLSTVHAKDAEYLAALCFAEGTMIGSMQKVNLGVFRVHVDGDRVGLKPVAPKLIDGAGRVCEYC